ncbi:MAG: hypothetical protein K2K54_13890, partial [Lachnospiraceae bacterium]|nr:hypothetical protein [Lachnospiraceae bacterium]
VSGSTDTKSKSIQNEITGARQQMQKLSSKEELSANERTTEQRKLRKEISSLNTELKQHQDELLKSQKREIMMAKLQEEQKPEKEEKSADKVQAEETSQSKADKKSLPSDKQQNNGQETVIAKNNDGTVILKDKMNQNGKRGTDAVRNQVSETSLNGADEKNLPSDKLPASPVGGSKEDAGTEEETKDINNDTNAGLSSKEIHALVSSDASVQQADRQGTIIARIRDGIVILRGEIAQDEKRGIDTERKQAELEKMEKKEQRATAFQFSVLSGANNAMKSAARANDAAGEKNKTQVNTENNAFINAVKFSRNEEQAAQQRFYVSFGN